MKKQKFILPVIIFLLVICLMALAVWAVRYSRNLASTPAEYHQKALGFSVAMPEKQKSKYAIHESAIDNQRRLSFQYSTGGEVQPIFDISAYPIAEWDEGKINKEGQYEEIDRYNGNVYVFRQLFHENEWNDKDELFKIGKFAEEAKNSFKQTGEYAYRSANVFYSRNNDTDCGHVEPIQRVLDHVPVHEREALRQLFLGPSPEEKALGYSSFFNEDTGDIIKGFKISDGVAYINFIDIRTIMPDAGSSCGGAQFLAQIETTLKQFASVKKTVMAIDGRPEVFYEWLQLDCRLEGGCDSELFKDIN